MGSSLYYSLLQINKILGIEGSMALSERPVEEVLKSLEGGHFSLLIQSDNFFKETNEKGYEYLQENNSLMVAISLFILNFEKGNKGYTIFYLDKIYKSLDENSPIVPLLKLVEREFLQ